mgnify:FL=1
MPGKNNKSRSKKGKSPAKKTETAQVAPEPVVEETVAAPVQTTPAQKGGKAKAKRVSKKAQAAAAAVTATETEMPTETQAFTETETATVTQTAAGKRVRSFKVLLPGTQNYEGRFTGLTPYQAANKALSKYYRETNKPKKQITFSIRESTRGSKRSTYTYNGRREKLKEPVQYSIKDGRTIVKNYKNRLTKVKKAELANIEV